MLPFLFFMIVIVLVAGLEKVVMVKIMSLKQNSKKFQKRKSAKILVLIVRNST